MGNLTGDPELKFLKSGTAVANFSIAVNDRYKKGEKTVDEVSYFDIVVFGKAGENATEYLKKGNPVLIEGKLEQKRWEAKDGSKRSKVEIIALKVIYLPSSKSREDDDDYPTY
jgi:single-strand DNA-binding protein